MTIDCLDELTAARVDHVLVALRMRQAAGEAPAPGQITPDDLARLSRDLGTPVNRSNQ